jgi:hypothetical protein
MAQPAAAGRTIARMKHRLGRRGDATLRSGRSGSPARTRAVAAAVCAAAAILCGLVQSAVGTAQTPPKQQPVLGSSLTLTGASLTIPSSFFGLSIEYNGLSTFEKQGTNFDRLISLIRPEDGSKMVLRLGGKSADHFYWDTPTTGAPRSVFELNDQWLGQLAALVRQARLTVMLDMNLAVHSPLLAAEFAQAAVKAMPSGALAGVEIGNEPDLYWRQGDLEQERISTTTRTVPLNWELNYSASNYRSDYLSYAKALKLAVPGVPIGGPETVSAKPAWLDALEGLGPLGPSFLTVHRYASSNCWPSTSPFFPTIPLLLGEAASTGLANTVRGAVALAHSHNQQLRLTEVNSISCGGNVGVANAFATALWAPDALFELLSTGVDSVSWHLRPGAINAPFHPTAAGIVAQPELYGLAAFAQMTGPGAELLGSKVVNRPGLYLKAWVVRSSRGIQVMLINKGSRPGNVTLHLPTQTGPATVKLLRAPGVGADADVTFGGQTIGTDARWHGKQVFSTVNNVRGAYSVVVPKYTLALVSIPH